MFKRQDPMTELEWHAAPGDVLHAWLKPVGTGVARIDIRDGTESQVLEVAGPTRGYLPVTWTAASGGAVTLSWADDTVVSVIYGFTPADVAERGTTVLWTSPGARLDGARYRLHAHPPFGWMNDPNGLCEIDGVTHLFYQHNPNGRRWDTMHWGHATSRDGIRWTHLPVALHPRQDILRATGEQGGAYSGTVLPRPDGSLRFFYTDRQDTRRPASEHQMTALSTDRLSAGPSTPVLDRHPRLPGYRNDWRDPFVFTGPDGRLKMLLGGAEATGSLVLLYETDDPDGAEGWRFVDVLFREAGGRPIPAECPCLIALDGLGEGLWVLIFGLIGSRDEASRRRNLSRCHIGRFDGRRFEPLHAHELDFGADCYAMQTWHGREGPCGIAWAANWTDVFADRDFESAMTFPRRFQWDGESLLTPPVEAVASLRGDRLGSLAGGPVALPDGLGEVELAVEPGTPFALKFVHPTHEIALHFDGRELELRYDPPGHRIVPRYRATCPGLATLRIFIDVGLIEIFVDGGRACCTKRIDSNAPVEAVALEGVRPVRAACWALKPVWAST